MCSFKKKTVGIVVAINSITLITVQSLCNTLYSRMRIRLIFNTSWTDLLVLAIKNFLLYHV